ncbi:MAG: hypothetical protein LBM20_05045 [Rikenellaceae bacterium]|jgi:DNA repair exonuclease SbcCD ATPase subunit|nr:hypothetical protein [Rikenellaceae bacterium]
MKKIVLIALLFVCASCGGRQRATEAEADAAQLARELAQKDSLLNDVFASLNEISSNLTEIRDREGIVTANVSPEIQPETRAKIQQDITLIDDLLQKNRLSLQRLQGATEQLRRANVRVGELEALIAGYAKQIEDKDTDIALLRQELDSMQIHVAELNTALDSLQAGTARLEENKSQLEAQVEAQDTRLHAVYYIVGSERSLREAGIVERTGGLFSGAVKLSQRYDLDQLTRVDLRSLDRIVVGQRRATVVTPHPADSYQLVEGSDKALQEILITDPKRFWETSKVLVVSYK